MILLEIIILLHKIIQLVMKSSHLVEVLYLVSPGEPELWPTVNKNNERFAVVSGLNIVKPHTVDCQILVLSVLWIQQTGGRT